MITLLDTNALIFDALKSQRLTHKARNAIEIADKQGTLACADISLWEIAMLLRKDRLTIQPPPLAFIKALLSARNIRVLPITPEIAFLSQEENLIQHKDPADRLILATAIHHKARLITSDKQILKIKMLDVIW